MASIGLGFNDARVMRTVPISHLQFVPHPALTCVVCLTVIGMDPARH